MYWRFGGIFGFHCNSMVFYSAVVHKYFIYADNVDGLAYPAFQMETVHKYSQVYNGNIMRIRYMGNVKNNRFLYSKFISIKKSRQLFLKLP
jgi:hypothetical protein